MNITLSALGISLAYAALGAGALYIFFAGFKEKWPISYTVVTSELDAHHRRGVINFLLVRLSPVILISGMAGTFAAGSGGRADVAAASVGLLHVAVTEIRGLWTRRRDAPPSLVAYYLFSTVIVLGGAVLGGYLGSNARWLFPNAIEMRDALWTAAAVAVLAGWYLQKAAKHPEPTSTLNNIQQDVGEELWNGIPALACKHGADPYLIQAIVAAEVTQRPLWMRRLERRLPWQATYGVAQVKSEIAISDKESIEELARTFTGMVPARHLYGNLAYKHRLINVLENHNSSPPFISDVIKYLETLPPSPIEQSEMLAPDGFPHLTVLTLRRRGATLAISGTWYGELASLRMRDGGSQGETFTLKGGDSVFGTGCTKESHPGCARLKWESRLPVDLESLAIIGKSDSEEHRIDMDFSYASVEN